MRQSLQEQLDKKLEQYQRLLSPGMYLIRRDRYGNISIDAQVVEDNFCFFSFVEEIVLPGVSSISTDFSNDLLNLLQKPGNPLDRYVLLGHSKMSELFKNISEMSDEDIQSMAYFLPHPSNKNGDEPFFRTRVQHVLYAILKLMQHEKTQETGVPFDPLDIIKSVQALDSYIDKTTPTVKELFSHYNELFPEAKATILIKIQEILKHLFV
jgi:hypothetical protein